MEADVLAKIGADDEALARRAISVLTQLESGAANDVLIEILQSKSSEAMLRAAFTSLLTLEADCYADVRPLFSHRLMSIREALVNLIAARMNLYGEAVRDHFVRSAIAYESGAEAAAKERETMKKLGVSISTEGEVLPHSSTGRILGIDEWRALETRALRTLIGIYIKSDALPDAALADAAEALLASKDWGVRADAARLIRKWQKAKGADYATIKAALDALRKMLAAETEPYVLFAGEA